MRMFTEVGRRALPHSTAVGKVLLAWQDEEHVRRVLTRLGLPARTPNTLTSVQEFSAELATVRGCGWAVDDEEEELGVRCMAVPVGPGERAVAAVSVSAPASRLPAGQADVVEALRDVAGELARSLESPDE
jgi:IclR family acetate operon transcriptional repressor